MFDTMKVAKRIRSARIARNMTQMELADAMGVSYQAVSNWERGNSMPDISKLADLCSTLHLSVDELLGIEKETAAVSKVMNKEPLSVEELADIAPMLPPEQMEAETRKATGGKAKFNATALAGIAMFMDDDLLEELIEDAQVDSLADLASLAPFMGSDLLDKLVKKAPKGDISGITALAPFLDDDTMDWIICQCDKSVDGELISALAPFLSEHALDHLVKNCDMELDRKLMKSLAPFLSEETIDALADQQIARGNGKALSEIYCFMSSQTVRKVAKALMAQGDLEALREAAEYM